MRFGKRTMFLALNGAILSGLLIYFSLWLLSPRVTAQVQRPLAYTRMVLTYDAGQRTREAVVMRNGVELAQKEVMIRHFLWDADTVRVNSFIGIAGEPLAWWLVFLLASSALLLTNNSVFTRGTVFELRREFPWISMEEYFPYHGRYRREEAGSSLPVRRRGT